MKGIFGMVKIRERNIWLFFLNAFWLIYVVANTADRAYKQLSLTIGDDSAYRSAVSTIGNLSKKTLSSKGDVEAMVSELAALG